MTALDHLVIDTRQAIDTGVESLAGLGFTLTPRGYHTLGSMNNLAVFGRNYLELIAFRPGQRLELEAYPVGLNGLVLRSTDAVATFAAAMAKGVAMREAGAFSRPVNLGDGTQRDAAFRTTHVIDPRAGIGRVYFCEHLTPELVWRAEWQRHANGARDIARVLIAAADPVGRAEFFARLFGIAVERAEDGAALNLDEGVELVFAPEAALRDMLGEAAPQAAGRPDYMAAIVFRVDDIAPATDLLKARPGVDCVRGQVIVPAALAMNTALIFEEEA